MRYYKSLIERTRKAHKEELKGFIPQKEAISLLGVAFNTFKKWVRTGQLERKEIEGAVWVKRKDVLKRIEEIKGRKEERKEALKRGFVLDLQEARFLRGLIADHGTEEQKAYYSYLQRKLETQIKRLSPKKGEA